MSLRLVLLNTVLRRVAKPYMGRASDPVRAREAMERGARLLPMPRGARTTETLLARRPALVIAGPPDAPLLVWLHGGAYVMGSPATHAALVGHIARRARLRAVLPDYRLAPEHPFPAAPEDALACYRALLARGEPAARIAIGGDSAGGGLALALLHMIAAEGLPPPGAALLFSPWTDLTLSGGTLRSLAARDVMLPAGRLAEIRDLYLAGADPADPRASPRLGRFRASPPTLILASRAEILLDDARMAAARLREHGVAAALDLFDDVPHAWPLFAGLVPEADRAVERGAAFLSRQLNHTTSG